MYKHRGNRPAILHKDPVDPDTTGDWVYFVLDDWLTTGESITSHSATVVGGTVVTQSTAIGATTIDGVEYTNVYGVEFAPSSGATSVTVTLRVTTTKAGPGVDLGRTDVDHSAVLSVESL